MAGMLKKTAVGIAVIWAFALVRAPGLFAQENYEWSMSWIDVYEDWRAIASSQDGTILVLGAYGGFLYSSSDSGNTWTQRIDSVSRSWRAAASSSDGSKMVAVVWAGNIYTSSNYGETWTEHEIVSSGHWISVASSSDGSKLAAAETSGYVYTSTDYGATWVKRTGSGSREWNVIASSSDGTKLVAVAGSISAGNHIYTSTDSGETWTERAGPTHRNWQAVTSSSDGVKLAAAVDGGNIYTSGDSGVNWAALAGAGSRDWSSLAMSSDGVRLIAADSTTGNVYTSVNSGVDWAEETSTSGTTVAMIPDGSRVFVLGEDALGIYVGGTSEIVFSPDIDTPASGSITTTSAILGANIRHAGGTITAAGVAYGTSINPELSGTHVSTDITGGNFTVSVTGLSSNTLYHYRGYATNSAATSYTADSTFTTMPQAPVAGAATNVTASSFTANWSAAPGTADVTYRLDVATDSDFTNFVGLYNGREVSGISESIGSLDPITYYYRVRAVNAQGASENSATITVTHVPPTVNTPVSSSISRTGATLGATVQSDGGSELLTVGVVYATTPDPVHGGDGVILEFVDVPATGAFTVNVVNLLPDTVYHYRGYAINSSGPSYSADATFRTGTHDWSAHMCSSLWRYMTFSADGTHLVGAINGNHIHSSTDYGANWTALTNSGVRAWSAVTSSADGSKLVAGTLYESGGSGRIYTSSDYGATWTQQAGAGERTWMHLASSADGQKIIAAVESGYLYTSSDSGVTWNERTGAGSRSWSSVASSSNGVRLAATRAGSGTYVYISDDSGVTWTEQPEAGSRDWRAAAMTADGSKLYAAAYGGGLWVWTASEGWALLPTGLGAWTRLTCSPDGTMLVGAVGQKIYTSFDSGQNWSEQMGPGSHYWHHLAMSADGSKVAASQMDPGCVYIGSIPTAPLIDTPTATPVGPTEEILGAYIRGSGGSTMISSGVYFGTDPDPSGPFRTSDDTSGEFTISVTPLSGNTLYYFKAYAENYAGRSYADEASFITLPDAPESAAATGIGATGFTANWEAVSGTEAVTYRLDVATNSGFTSYVTGYQNRSVTGTSRAVTGLNPGQPYWYRVRAVNATGTSANSDSINVETALAAPTVNTPTATALGTTSATLGATIQSNGGAAVTGAGVAYGTSANPTIGGTKVVSDAISGAFTVSATGLTPNTLYHYRGYATNSVNTGYTADATFTTVANAPTANAATAINETGFTANWAAPSGAATITQYRLDVATDSNFASLVSGYGNLAVPGTSMAVTGLNGGTPYWYRVRAVNAGGASASSEPVEVHTLETSSITLSAPDGGEILRAGSGLSIAWTYTGTPGADVLIELLKDGLTELVIEENAPIGSGGVGSFGWSVPSGLRPGMDYRIRITSTTKATCTALSGEFTISGDITPVLKLLLD